MAKITYTNKDSFGQPPQNMVYDTDMNEIKTSVNALYDEVEAITDAETIEFMGRTYGVVQNPTTGRYWLDRNLGATQVANAVDDADAYGDLYQWGRFADGHQLRLSGTTATLATSNNAGSSDFITASASPFDWRNPQNDNLWQAVARINIPAPIGWRLPTEDEWEAEIATWDSANGAGAFASVLKLTYVGSRSGDSGSISDVGTSGSYWSSTVSSVAVRGLNLTSSNATIDTIGRNSGRAIRLIKAE